MWFSFWRSRDRLSLDEFRFLVDQLIKVEFVNEVNKEFVIEALRSIAELITWGDQHDATYFEFFMEKQVIGEFVRILRICKSVIVSRQLLQTMSIMIQNLKSEHSIYYMFSNEHVNYLITYPFDFRNEELLSYYISFVRAISGKLNRDTISLLVKSENDEIVGFPLYVEAIRFAFHDESMIRTAVRSLTLNVYHVGDEALNRFISRAPHADYFLNLVKFFQEQCIHLDKVVSSAKKSLSVESPSSILSAVDEIEDNLYYFSDVVSAGIPDVGRLIMDNVFSLLIFPLILPSFGPEAVREPSLGAATSLYLLCCILRIVKVKDLANTVAAALLCYPEIFPESFQAKLNGNVLGHASSDVLKQNKDVNHCAADVESLQVTTTASSSDCGSMKSAPGEALLSFIVNGDEVQVSGSLNVLATLLQTKELDETMVDALGILPQCKQHKKNLLKALVEEDSAEEQLFSSEGTDVKDGNSCELDMYLQKLKEYIGISCAPHLEVGVSPRVHRFQVLDSLVHLFCRSNISAETLWDGGWLLRQLLPYSEAEFNSHHLILLKDSFHHCTTRVLEEARGTWSDLLLTVICEEWRMCKRAIESSSPRKDPKYILLLLCKSPIGDYPSTESSFAAGERMCETVKVFALLHHLYIFSLGRILPDQPPVFSAVDILEKSRARNAGLNLPDLRPSAEINLVDAIPCRIAFERGKERHFHFLALSIGSSSGWLVLAEEMMMKPGQGLVRVVAPLAGCNPRTDDTHSRWLHLRIRPSSFPFTDTAHYTAHGRVKSKALVDGRWTLAFGDEESCKHALSMIQEEMKLQSCALERSLQPVLELDTSSDHSDNSD